MQLAQVLLSGTAESWWIFVIVRPTKGLFLTLTREMFALTDLTDVSFDGFQCIKIFHCELSLHHQLLKTVLKVDFIILMLASKTKIPLLLKAIAASSTLSAEYSLQKAWDKPLLGYQHLL